MRIRLPHEWSPRSYQQPAWDYLNDGGKRACLIWHRRCFAIGTQIVLANGQWKPIEDLAVGDEILSWNGFTTCIDRVKNKWSAGKKLVISYKASGFPKIEVTRDHRFRGFHPQWHNAGWVQISEIQRRNLAVAQFKKGYFPLVGIDAGDLAELVGYLITDGYVTVGQQPKFTNNNRFLIDRVAQLANGIFGITPIVRSKGRGFDVGLSNGTRGGGETSNPLKEWFRAENALASKRDRRIPKQVWLWNERSLWQMFGAVIAGDGSIYSQKNGRIVTDVKRGKRSIKPAAQVTIHAGMSYGLAQDYVQLLRKLGIASTIEKETRGENWKVRLTRQDCIKRFLQNIIAWGKEDKRCAALRLCENRRDRQSKFNLEKAGVKAGASRICETFDIETEKHHCFFANGYLVHNSGKDDVALNWACIAGHERVGEYWHMLPEAAQGRKVIWDAVSPHTGRRRIDHAFPEVLRDKTRDDEMVIRLKSGSLWRVVGSDNYESLLGATPAGVVFSEWALADPNAWAFLRPILMENKGWAIFITTPRGTNHAYKTLDLAKSDKTWFSQVLTADDTGIFTQEQLQGELYEYQHDYGDEEGKALFEQEYYCSFESALVGSYYGSYLSRAAKDGRILARIPIDRTILVHTAWDLGVTDSTAIWFIQRAGREYRLIDYHEGAGVGLDEYARVLDTKRQEHKWVYGNHYFPHDMAVKELGNKGKSRADSMQELGYKPTIVPQSNVLDGINATRKLLDQSWIDETRCERGLNALRNYRRAWDDRLKMFRDAPIHDWSSHGADALRTFASGYRDPRERPKLTISAVRDNVGSTMAGSMHDRGTGWLGRQ